jgi:hypothetical protein
MRQVPPGAQDSVRSFCGRITTPRTWICGRLRGSDHARGEPPGGAAPPAARIRLSRRGDDGSGQQTDHAQQPKLGHRDAVDDGDLAHVRSSFTIYDTGYDTGGEQVRARAAASIETEPASQYVDPQSGTVAPGTGRNLARVANRRPVTRPWDLDHGRATAPPRRPSISSWAWTKSPAVSPRRDLADRGQRWTTARVSISAPAVRFN